MRTPAARRANPTSRLVDKAMAMPKLKTRSQNRNQTGWNIGNLKRMELSKPLPQSTMARMPRPEWPEQACPSQLADNALRAALTLSHRHFTLPRGRTSNLLATLGTQQQHHPGQPMTAHPRSACRWQVRLRTREPFRYKR